MKKHNKLEKVISTNYHLNAKTPSLIAVCSGILNFIGDLNLNEKVLVLNWVLLIFYVHGSTLCNLLYSIPVSI